VSGGWGAGGLDLSRRSRLNSVDDQGYVWEKYSYRKVRPECLRGLFLTFWLIGYLDFLTSLFPEGGVVVQIFGDLLEKCPQIVEHHDLTPFRLSS